MSDLSSLSSNESEEEQPIPRVRVLRDRNNLFELYNNRDFKLRFRFNKETVVHMLEIFGHFIEPVTHRNKSICARDQLLITLRFYATGAFQRLIGDTFNIHNSTICRIIGRVTHHIAALGNRYIRMPTTNEERNIVKIQFYNLSGFPNVIGAVDCTHIRIQSPGGHNAELFRNRKGYFSINVQVICDSHLRVRDIVCRWPGSVHDSTIFNDSAINAQFINGNFDNYYLLGDSGYPCKTYLLTPILNARNPSEIAYSNAHRSTRSVVERCFGVVKRRFPCLSVGLRSAVNKTLGIIVACFVLHNIAVEDNDNEPELDPDIVVPADIEGPEFEGLFNNNNNNNNNNTAVRSALVRTVFAR